MKVHFLTLCAASIGSNPNIMNFELLRTWQAELRTHSNPGSFTKTELRTLSNPSKCLNFELFWHEIGQTQAQIWKNRTSNPSEPRFVKSNRTTNPPKISNFNPTNWVCSNTNPKYLHRFITECIISILFSGYFYPVLLEVQILQEKKY